MVFFVVFGLNLVPFESRLALKLPHGIVSQTVRVVVIPLKI